MPRLILHIGTHKTGSTALQNYLWAHRNELRDQGCAYYEGIDNVNNHVELYLASMRYERDSFAKQRRQGIVFDESYTQRVAERVQGFVANCDLPNVIFSCEGLSLLRHRDEIERLIRVLGSGPDQVEVIVALRRKEDFLESYKHQLRKKKRTASRDYWSALYVEPDTWLTDFETLLSVYEWGFGKENIARFDYDAEMAKTGNCLPVILDQMGLDYDADIISWFCNRTLSKKKRRRGIARFWKWKSLVHAPSKRLA